LDQASQAPRVLRVIVLLVTDRAPSLYFVPPVDWLDVSRRSPDPDYEGREQRTRARHQDWQGLVGTTRAIRLTTATPRDCSPGQSDRPGLLGTRLDQRAADRVLDTARAERVARLIADARLRAAGSKWRPDVRTAPRCSRRRTSRYRPVGSTPSSVPSSRTVMPGRNRTSSRTCSSRRPGRALRRDPRAPLFGAADTFAFAGARLAAA
jgi:hypothetical protein